MNDKPDNLIPVAQPVEPGLQTALAGILDVNTTDDIPLTRDAIDVYQGYLQTMWDRVALPLGTTATAHVFRSILLQDDRPMGPLRRYFDITEKGISLRRLEDRVGQTGSATLMSELLPCFPNCATRWTRWPARSWRSYQTTTPAVTLHRWAVNRTDFITTPGPCQAS